MRKRPPEWFREALLRLLSGARVVGRFVGLAVGLSFVGGFPVAIGNEWGTWGQLFAFLFLAIMFGALVYVLLEPILRVKLIDGLVREEPVGWATPFLLAGGTILFASSVFGLGTLLLDTAGAIELRDPLCQADCRLTAGDVSEFYLWHALEAIPLLQIDERIGWDEPLHYQGALTGWIVVAFYITTIVPIYQAFRGYWKRRAQVPRVRLQARPRIALVGEPVRLNWVMGDPPPGFVFDLQIARPPTSDQAKAKRKDRFRNCLWGTSATSGTFFPDAPGEFGFRARWRKPGTVDGVSELSRDIVIVARQSTPSEPG